MGAEAETSGHLRNTSQDSQIIVPVTSATSGTGQGAIGPTLEPALLGPSCAWWLAFEEKAVHRSCCARHTLLLKEHMQFLGLVGHGQGCAVIINGE